MRIYCIIILSFSLVTGCAISSRPQKAELIKQWETANKTFKIRVSEYGEKSWGPSGAYYVFESAPLNSDDWQEIMTFRQDDQVGIPKDQVRFVNDQIGFIFMGWMCAVTKDGGGSWSIWDAAKDLPDWQCCNHGLIGNISIESNGTGVMMLNPIAQRRGEVAELRTEDYGQHWAVK